MPPALSPTSATPGGVGADLGGVDDGPLQRGVGLLVLHWVVRFGRRGVVDEDDDRLGMIGELAVEPLVGVLVAQDPAAAVAVEHHRQYAGRGGGSDDPDTDPAGRPAPDDQVFDVSGLQLDTDAGLDLPQRLARVLG